MDEQEQVKKKSQGRTVLLAIVLFLITIGGVLLYFEVFDDSPTSFADAKYVGSNRKCEVVVNLRSNADFSITITYFANGYKEVYSGRYEFLGEEGKVVKFVFSDGSSTRCSRMIAVNFEYISMDEINPDFPAVYRK